MIDSRGRHRPLLTTLVWHLLDILGRCQSGRLGPPAKRLTVLKPFMGSNPILPALTLMKLAKLPKSGYVCEATDAPLAQRIRASGYEPEGREFESLRARHFALNHPLSDEPTARVA